MVKIIFYKAKTATKNKWLHRLISWRTKGPYSHCEIYFTRSKQTFSADPMTNKCKFKLMNNIDPKHWDVVDTTLNDDLVYQLCQSNKYKNARYDYLGILFNFIVPINRHSRTKFFCSEVVVDVAQDLYYHVLLGFRGYKIDPNKLYRILTNG